jgi:hypothetical protein
MFNNDGANTPASTTPAAAPLSLMDRLLSVRQPVSPENAEALAYRSSKGYKPVDIQEKYIDVNNREDFNKYRKELRAIPNDPKTRNELISRLGYKPVLRYQTKEVVETPTETKTLIPRKKYELSFSTMPDKKIQLNSEEEFNQANMINDIDTFIGDKYKKQFNPEGLDRANSYQSYQTASKDPSKYGKMYFTEQQRNAAITEYAKSKGLDPNIVLTNYTQNRDKYYPSDLVSGSGQKEVNTNKPSSTLYGYRNFLTTMQPKAETYNEEVITPGVNKIENIKEETYPFKYGYKGTTNERPSITTAPRRNPPGGGCIGNICEKAADAMESRNKYLFKRKDGGLITKVKATNLLY